MRLLYAAVALCMVASSGCGPALKYQANPDNLQYVSQGKADKANTPSSAISITEDHQPVGAARDKETHQGDSKSSKWLEPIVVINALYVLISFLMLRAIKGQGNQIERQIQLADNLSKWTAEGAEYARRQWRATHEQDMTLRGQLTEMERLTKETRMAAEATKITAEAALIANRPLITIEIRSSTWDNFTVTATNIGKNPAEIWRTDGEFHFIESQSELPQEPTYAGDDRWVLAHKPIAVPNDPLPVYSIPVGALRDGDASLMRQVDGFKRELYIWGRVSYGIPAKKQITFETRWCFKYIPGTRPTQDHRTGQPMGGIPPNMVRGGLAGYNEHS